MKIYTKTGDSGETGLFGGGRVPKDHPRLQAYGTIDELNAGVGWLIAVGLEASLTQLLQTVQHRLFAIGAELATPEKEKLVSRAQAVSHEDVALLEKAIDQWEKSLAPLKNFILPGGSEAGGRAHVVRTVVRRAERELITLSHGTPISAEILQFVNRLSDFFFVLARHLNQTAKTPEIPWQKS